MLLLASGGLRKGALAFAAGGKPVLRFAVTSDGHYGEKGTPYDEYYPKIVGAINDLHVRRPLAFCVANGDLMHNDPAMLEPAARILKTLAMPLYVTKGNHDRVTDERWASVWGMPVNHDVRIGDDVLLLGNTANIKGEYLEPDVDWFREKLVHYKDARSIFIFLHITPVKWTENGVDGAAFQKLVRDTPNIRAIFNGHDHDQDGIKFLGNTPFLFDGHFGGSWGTAYKGFRVVEMLEDNSLLTYLMDPVQQMPVVNLYK